MHVCMSFKKFSFPVRAPAEGLCVEVPGVWSLFRLYGAEMDGALTTVHLLHGIE